MISDFRCPKNEEIQHFARDNAYEFAKKKISVTYLVVDKEDYIAAIFTLAHKAIEIGDGKLSNSKRRKINRYAVLDSASGNYTVSAFLIAQFGKNYAEDVSTKISGNHLMDLTFAVLEKIQHDMGVGLSFWSARTSLNCWNFIKMKKMDLQPLEKGILYQTIQSIFSFFSFSDFQGLIPNNIFPHSR